MSEDDDSKFPSELAERFQVRMPLGMRDRIKAAAEANNRSMNAELLATLTRGYPPPRSRDEVIWEIIATVARYDDNLIEEAVRGLSEIVDSSRLGRFLDAARTSLRKPNFDDI